METSGEGGRIVREPKWCVLRVSRIGLHSLRPHCRPRIGQDIRENQHHHIPPRFLSPHQLLGRSYTPTDLVAEGQ